jgi:hypothetical protein
VCRDGGNGRIGGGVNAHKSGNPVISQQQETRASGQVCRVRI